MVLDYIGGQPLTKKMLRTGSEEHRRRFLEEMVDILAQLRGLEFPQRGSLMPNTTGGIWARLWAFISPREESFVPPSTLGSKSGTKRVGAFSMRKNEVQVMGYTVPRLTAATSKEFFGQQYQLLQDLWRIPCQELRQEEAERQEFALHALSLEKAYEILGLEGDSSEDIFCLSHHDLRTKNIIVDDELHVRGVTDWEFSATVPRHAFLPPEWVTGHDIGSIGSTLPSEFMSVLSTRKQLSSSHFQLAQHWNYGDSLRLPMAYIFLDLSNLDLLFYRYIYPRLYQGPRDEVVPAFFQKPENKELLMGLECRLRASEQCTHYLKENDHFDEEKETEWEEAQAWITDAREKLHQLAEWSDKTQEKLTRLEEERAILQQQRA